MTSRTTRPNLAKIFVLLGIGLVLIGGTFIFFKKNKIKPRVKLSPQQQKLVKQFGYPSTFTLIFGEMMIEAEYQPARLEIWNYDQLGRRFYFVDGQFVKDADLSFVEEARYPDLKPTWFDRGMTLDQVKEIIGAEPSVEAELIPKIIEKGKIYDFYGQVKVGEIDGKIVYLQTYPVTTEGAGTKQ